MGGRSDERFSQGKAGSIGCVFIVLALVLGGLYLATFNKNLPVKAMIEGFMSPSNLLVIAIAVFVIGLLFFLVTTFQSTDATVRCQSCGWKGPVARWRGEGACPGCGNPIFPV